VVAIASLEDVRKVLSTAENDLLCQVGPGTPMGDAMRRYWWPVLLADELPLASDPILVRLLGERFVAFRDGEGHVGILDEYCRHRGASLLIGRVEDCGIRCVYHGWKFAVDGTLLHVPNVASKTLRGVSQPSYPVREAGGFIWIYIGPAEHEPPFRHMPWMDLPASQLELTGFLCAMNYLAELENHADGAHITSHRDAHLDPEFKRPENTHVGTSLDAPPIRSESEETDFGMYSVIIRDDPAGSTPIYTNVVAFVMPTTVIITIPNGSLYFIDVPVDDVTTLTLFVRTSATGPLPQLPPIWEQLPHLCQQMPGRLLASLTISEENRYLQDRDAMRNGSRYSGFLGRPSVADRAPGMVLGIIGSLFHQDFAVMLSQGSYPTRSMEHPVPTDAAVLKLRRILAGLARQVAAGQAPPSLKADLTDVAGHDGHHVGDWHDLVP
jgi:nitrite reductase/ring-hydroxylating ferredoxin subunit